MQLAETVRQYLGWCPNADARIQERVVRHRGISEASTGGDATPIFPAGWLNRYRNWLLLWALYNIPVFLSLGTLVLTSKGSYVPFFTAGIAIGCLVFILNAHRLWRQYNDILVKGYLEESHRKRNLILYLVVSLVILLICFEMLVFLGYIPGIDLLIVPAFMIGLSIIPWCVLLLVIMWESRTGCRLYLDRKGKNASMYVVRG